MTRNEKIAQHIAKAIMRNTNKRFSTLHSEVLDIIRKEDQMTNSPSPTTSGLNTQSPVVPTPEIKKAINSGGNADHVQFPAQTPVRAEVPAPTDKL